MKPFESSITVSTPGGIAAASGRAPESAFPASRSTLRLCSWAQLQGMVPANPALLKEKSSSWALPFMNLALLHDKSSSSKLRGSTSGRGPERFVCDAISRRSGSAAQLAGMLSAGVKSGQFSAHPVVTVARLG